MRPRQVLSRGPLVAALVVAALTVAGCSSTPELQGVVRADPLEVGDVTLPDVTAEGRRGGGLVEDGRLVMRAAADDRLLVVYFGFLNCPDVCPTTLADLRSALARLDAAQRERVDLAFVTVDPDRDGPEELAAYLPHFAPRHHALRAEGAELDAALDAFLASASVEVADDGSVDVAHSALLYAVDADGRVVVEWPFGTSADALADDLTVLLARGAAA